MTFNFLFILNSILFGFGLAMDAFSVSLANGLRDPQMHPSRRLIIAGTFGGFQTLMPLLGWVCVHYIAETFRAVQKFIPWIALILLVFIGVKMIRDAIHEQEEAKSLQGTALLVQGIATSIDALSVGFTIERYDLAAANLASLIIGGVTFVVCVLGLILGRRAGTRLSRHASVLGGVILIAIGFRILLEGLG